MLLHGVFGRFFGCFRVAGLVLVLAVAGCATRPGPEVLGTVAPVAGVSEVTVYTATTRTPSRALAPQGDVYFTSERAHGLTYGRFAVSIPPGHEPAKIEWPIGAPDPATSFAVVDQTVLPEQAFLDEVHEASRAAGGVGVGIFVHGFNYSFPETVFRLAQLSTDAQIEAPQIAFSWPSQGTLRAYLDDKNSATYSRDYLADLIVNLAARQGIGEINVVGHSMGAWLVMETLRQLRLEGRDDVVNRLRVILAAPDIDVDVFRQQLEVIGPLPSPMMVLVSTQDRALQLSQLLSASRPRIGTLDVRDPGVQAAARMANVQFVDISSVEAPGGAGHDRYVALATTIPDEEAGTGPAPLRDLRQAGAFVLTAVGLTLATPFDIAGQVLAGE